MAEGYSGLKPGHDAVIVHIAPALSLFGCKRHRHPQIGRGVAPGSASKRKFEGIRHHADDGIWLAVQLDRPAKDGRIPAIRLLPQAVTQDYDRMAGVVF